MATKVLCLHGWGTSPEFMTLQLKHFIKFFPEMVFECMPGPIEIPESIVGDPAVIKLSPNKKYYAWKLNLLDEIASGEPMDLNLAMDSIIEYMNANGPFDGICGFSMGGMVSQSFIEQYEQGKFKDRLKVEGPKFVMLCSANYYKTNNELLKTPSIHIVGDKDFLLDASVLVTTNYLNPLILRHCESHKFPKLSQYEIDAIRKYLRPILMKNKKNVPRPRL